MDDPQDLTSWATQLNLDSFEIRWRDAPSTMDKRVLHAHIAASFFTGTAREYLSDCSMRNELFDLVLHPFNIKIKVFSEILFSAKD